MTTHPPTDDPRWDRLIHLVAGELPADEAASLRTWVAAHPERQQILARLEALWHATAPLGSARPEAWDAEAVLQRIRSEATGTGRIIARVGPRLELDKLGGRRARVGALVRAAAAVALVVGGGFLWRLTMRSHPTASVPVAMAAEYRTAAGERLSLGLPDGTRVLLAPGSVLRRAANYGARDRVVSLEGEAYFSVKHDPARPFAVRTARAVARDLGTRFVVRAYAEETNTDVVVAEGLVAVTPANLGTPGAGAPGDSLLVRPWEHARIAPTGDMTLARVTALEPYFGWTSGQLVFQRTPLQDVVRQLERWYGIDIQIADSAIRTDRLTATLQEEDASEAVDLVATSLRLAVSRAGPTYILTARAGR